MRLEEGLKEIPVILVTARGEEECVEAGWQSRCSDYITKANQLPRIGGPDPQLFSAQQGAGTR
jgi:CheY-like chemotaxis protein